MAYNIIRLGEGCIAASLGGISVYLVLSGYIIFGIIALYAFLMYNAFIVRRRMNNDQVI